MVDIPDGARGLIVRSLVVGAYVGTSEIVPILNVKITGKPASNRTWDNLKNQKNATRRSVVRRNKLIFSL